MKFFWRKFKDSQADYEPLIEVRISRDAILSNLRVFKNLVPDWSIAPVLKSNAYGHGLREVAQILEGTQDVAFLVVDSYFEARVLRTEGINKPILVIGHTLTDTILNNPFEDVSFAVANLSQLKELAVTKKTIRFHIKADTGMHRQGLLPDEIRTAHEILAANPHLIVEGLCSHLADADGDDPTFTHAQIKVWNEIVSDWRTKAPSTRFFHLSATKGVRYAKEIDANVLRLGIGLYGIDPVGELDLQPALSLHTRVTALRKIKAGESVGYNHTFTAMRDTTVATIPAGYYEGVDRRLSNKGFIEVRPHEEVEPRACPIIGRVSMNMTTIDVTDVPSVAEGSEVVVISADSADKNSAVSHAEVCGTIPYEILVHIPAQLRRVVV